MTLSSSSITRIRLRGTGNLLLRSRQCDGNRGALPRPAAKRECPAVLLDDFFSVGHTEAESLVLRCIERLEDLFHILLTDSLTRISDFESKHLVSPGDGDTQGATLAHGFDRI